MGAPVFMPGTVEERLLPFLEALRASGFSGDIAGDAASRIVYSTDNSIYQRAPAAVVFPGMARMSPASSARRRCIACPLPRVAAVRVPTASR